jgi:6-phosphofructokinase 1
VENGKLGIVVAGGPAPGINGVIAAATLRLRRAGMEVIGIEEGFRWLMQGDIDHVVRLEPDAVADIAGRGGSVLGTSRASPITGEGAMARTLESLARLGIEQLITIGGEGTAFTAYRLAERAARLKIVHVPKTIDNDLDLPDDVDTFGFQTARQVGVHIVKNLMIDSQATSRWYFVVAQGRKAGHLALSIGRAAGATLSLIPEEFAGDRVPLALVVDTLAAAIVKRRAQGYADGVALLAEGIADRIDPTELAAHADVPRDARGDVHVALLDLGALLRRLVTERLEALGMHVQIVDRSIGYELRCADPIPIDVEYTSDLGYCAARAVEDGASHVMVSIQHGGFRPIPLGRIIDLRTGRVRVRLVDVGADAYRIARAYMVRLRRTDLEDPGALEALAATLHAEPRALRSAFWPVVANDSMREPVFETS